MRIDKRLHLVVPIYKDEDVETTATGEKVEGEVTAYVHSAPLAEEIVDRFFMVLGRTYQTIFAQGLGLAAGPPNAMRVLRHVATEIGTWHDNPKTGEAGVEHGLVDEMRRLTNVAAVDKDGKWQQLPLEVAVQQGVLSSEDRAEVENAVAFFIVASATLGRAQRPAMLRAAAELWGARISSSPFTEFASSLKTSTATGSSGERSPAPARGEPDRANAIVDGKPRSVPV